MQISSYNYRLTLSLAVFLITGAVVLAWDSFVWNRVEHTSTTITDWQIWVLIVLQGIFCLVVAAISAMFTVMILKTKKTALLQAFGIIMLWLNYIAYCVVTTLQRINWNPQSRSEGFKRTLQLF
jgi:hypothetical protein